MAKLILTSYDFSQNQLIRPVLHISGSAPSSPVEGQLYYNNTGGDKKPYYYNGTAWTPMSTVSSVTLSFGSTTSAIFDTSGANSQTITSSGTFDVSLNDQTQNKVLAAPSGGTGSPTFRILVAGDIPSLSYLPLAGGTMTGAINMGNNLITNVASPVSNGDAVTKLYVDGLLDGRKWKQAVIAATTANITLSGTQTIDGIAVVANDRVLVKNQTTQSDNGIYLVASGAWTRATDADTGVELEGAAVFVMSGTVNGDMSYFQTTYPVTLGSSNVIWVVSATGAYTADGSGIELSGNTFSLELDSNTLSKSGAGLKVANNGITETQLNTSVAGGGLTGGGGTALAVGAGTGITVNANDIQVTSYTPITGYTVARKVAGSFTVSAAGAFSQVVNVDGAATSDMIVQLRDTNDAVIEADIDTTVISNQITIAGTAPTSLYIIKYVIIT